MTDGLTASNIRLQMKVSCNRNNLQAFRTELLQTTMHNLSVKIGLRLYNYLLVKLADYKRMNTLSPTSKVI